MYELSFWVNLYVNVCRWFISFILGISVATPMPIYDFTEPAGDTLDVTVMSYNVYIKGSGEKSPENRTPLVVENIRKQKMYHPRCGTSFMFFMILLGIAVGMIIRYFLPEGFPTIAYTGIRLLVLPLIVGIGYEYLMYAGKHTNFVTKIFSAPGLWVQRLTTKEPTDDMLEIAIVSTKCALRDVHPEFKEYFENRGWEPKQEPESAECAEASAASDSSEEAQPSEAEVDGGENTDKEASE